MTASCLAAGLMVLAGARGGSAQSRGLSATTTVGSGGATGPVATNGTGGGSTPSSSAASSSSFLLAPGRAAFLAPSGNINCQIDYASGATANAAFCETLSPAESASLAPAGSVKIYGIACEGNAADKTVTLA